MKKTTLKGLIAGVLAIAGTAGAASAATPEKYDRLPDKARTFISEYFGSSDIASVKKEQFPTEYEVVFRSGAKAEFDADGEWMEVDCRSEAVPSVIVPQPIREYVNEKYPNQKIVGVSRDRRGYDVELSNGYELGFDRKFRLVDFDD